MRSGLTGNNKKKKAKGERDDYKYFTFLNFFSYIT